MTFFKKINNNKGVDLQLSVVVMLLIFVMAIFMAIDFWMASSAKIILIKEIQSAEVYCLVKTVQGNYTKLRLIPEEDVFNTNLTDLQEEAVNLYGLSRGTHENLKPGEIYTRLSDVPYLRTWTVTDVKGTDYPAMGEFGIFTALTYSTNTLVRSPQQIFEVFRNRQQINNTSVKDIKLTVAAKVVPITWDGDEIIVK